MTIGAYGANDKDKSPVIINRFLLISAQGKSVDIRNLAEEFHLFESMRGKALHGYVIINDGVGLFEDFPILAQEKLAVEFMSANHENAGVDEYDHPCRLFEITKIDSIEQVNYGYKRYKLHFISHEGKLDLFVNPCRSFNNMKASEIVKELMTKPYPDGLGFPENGRNIEIDKTELTIIETKYNDRVIVSQKTPLEACVWLASRSVGDTGSMGEHANYVFFENTRGYQFTSIEALIQKAAGTPTEKLPKYVFGVSPRMYQEGIKRTNPLESIHEFRITSSFDFMRDTLDGVFMSDAMYYNIMTGDVETVHFDYLQDFKKISNVESNSQQNGDGVESWGVPPMALDSSNKNPLTKIEGVVEMFVPYYPTMYEQKPQNFVKPQQYTQLRYSQLKRFNNIVVEMDVAGNTMLHVGDMINVELNKPDGETLSSSRYRGRFLVRDIHHIITTEDYLMTVTAMKDCFQTEDKIGGENA